MSNEMTTNLQLTLDTIPSAAFIELNGKIILVNKPFSLQYLDFDLHEQNKNTVKKLKEKMEHNGKLVSEKYLNNDVKICELIDPDIIRLNDSKIKLTQAMSLL